MTKALIPDQRSSVAGTLSKASPDPEHAAALQHLLLAENAAVVIPGLGDEAQLRSIQTVGVIGAGTMGGGIAMNFANAGIAVVIVETSQEALNGGFGLVRKNYATSAAKGRLTLAQVEQRMALRMYCGIPITRDAFAMARCVLREEGTDFSVLEVKA